MKLWLAFRCVVCIGLIFLCMGCGSGPDDGLVKYPVTGQVLVNGTPQPGVVVTFNHTDTTVKGNAARPVAVTGEEGRFTLSTNGSHDGAVLGEYVVTFFWTDGGMGMVDFFKGKYTRVGTSKFRVTIGENDQELEPFRLEAPDEAIAAAERSRQSRRIPN